MPGRSLVVGTWVLLPLAACGHAPSNRVDAGPATVSVADGEDWSLPDGLAPAPRSGFFSEEAAPEHAVDVHVIDVSWRQLNPQPGVIATTTTGSAQGLDFASFDAQRALPGRFWVRIWASGVDWAPAWVIADCDVAPISGTDDEGTEHLPLWNPCVWGHLRTLYADLFGAAGRGLAADPDLVMVYVPGAFTWCEFDFDMIERAADEDGLSFATFDAWFHGAIADLVAIFGADAGKLVYTGEDYPYSSFGAADDLLARDAVAAGTSIRTGITEVSNTHLSEAPAYGTTIGDDGHLVTDDAWELFDAGRIAATENECYDDCGFQTDDLAYAIRQSNLKALQLRMNWIYVVPDDSYLAQFADHWRWVQLELGRTASDAPDAWAQLRDAEDTYWTDDGGKDWDGFPYVKNLERWLVQRDVAPDGLSRRGTEVRSAVLDPSNGTAYEGRRTDHAAGSDHLYFDVDEAFLDGERRASVDIKVTYRALGKATWSIEYAATSGGTARTPTVTNDDSGEVRTATFGIDDAAFDDSMPGSTDFRIDAGGSEDVEIDFVRVVKR
jgi:hypothetical protein